MAQRKRTDELTEQVGRTQKAARLRFFHEQGARKKRSKRNRCSCFVVSIADKYIMLFFNGFVTHIEPDYIFPSGGRILTSEIVLDGISKDFSLTLSIFLSILLGTDDDGF